MKALVCRKLGDPLSKDERRPLQLVTNFPKEAALPAGSVRIKVAAAALNFADVLQVQGLYQEKPRLPFVPGGEVSGRVIEVGDDVKAVQVGDSVCAVTLGRAFAEEVVVKEASILKLRNVRDLESAAGLPVAFGTAHLSLIERAQLKAGQSLLVLGAAGGVGIAAVQIAKVVGARTVAVARGEAKCKALKELGADVVIDPSTHQGTPLRDLIKRAAPHGIDVVLDPVGGEPFNESLKVVKWGAHILIIGFATGNIPKIPANIALVKNLTVHGIYWGSYMQKNPRPLLKGLQELAQWLAEGKIVVPSTQRYAFEDAQEGFRTLMSRDAIGKVLLLPNAQTAKL